MCALHSIPFSWLPHSFCSQIYVGHYGRRMCIQLLNEISRVTHRNVSFLWFYTTRFGLCNVSAGYSIWGLEPLVDFKPVGSALFGFELLPTFLRGFQLLPFQLRCGREVSSLRSKLDFRPLTTVHLGV